MKRAAVTFIVTLGVMLGGGWAMVHSGGEAHHRDVVADTCARAVGVGNTAALARCIEKVGR
jgi:hypothetical protein